MDDLDRALVRLLTADGRRSNVDLARDLGVAEKTVKNYVSTLLAKLGENYRRVSAVFIWSYIKRLFSAREGSAKKEHMGHVRGGYKTVFERLQSLIREQGGNIRLGVAVERVSAGPGGGMRVLVDVRGGAPRLFSRNEIDATVSFPELAGMPLDDALLDGEVVAFADGLPSFAALAERMHVLRADRARALAERIPKDPPGSE